MRETTSSSGAASSSGSLNGCTPSATPATSSNSRCSSAFGTVGTKETPSTSSRPSTSAHPAFDIVVGSSSFFLLVPVVLVVIFVLGWLGLEVARTRKQHCGVWPDPDPFSLGSAASRVLRLIAGHLRGRRAELGA